jgi:hypothetical protein
MDHRPLRLDPLGLSQTARESSFVYLDPSRVLVTGADVIRAPTTAAPVTPVTPEIRVTDFEQNHAAVLSDKIIGANEAPPRQYSVEDGQAEVPNGSRS